MQIVLQQIPQQTLAPSSKKSALEDNQSTYVFTNGYPKYDSWNGNNLKFKINYFLLFCFRKRYI